MNSLTPEERRYWFPEDFFDAIDSWFSADIACCDSCHEEFLAKWPHAYSADDAEFQRCGYPLDIIYSGSRLSELYGKIEFDTYILDITCPRCGEVLGPNIWPYSFPFDVDPDFENTITEIALIAKETPFLLLKHDFARQVFDTLLKLGKITLGTPIESPLYRARPGRVAEEIVEFDAPIPGIVKEGRYNHAGSPVIYFASDAKTCIEEMNRVSCTIAEVEISVPLKTLDLNTPESSHPNTADELSALAYSALMSAKQTDDGWEKPAYVFSRFVADCAKVAGFQAIKYPSTQITAESNFNLVIVDPIVRLVKHARLKQCERFEPKA